MIIRQKQGATLVELMMVVALVSIIFVGIIMIIQKVSKGTWSLTGNLELNRNASEAMYWISKDFVNAKASSMGNQAQLFSQNLIQNPSFENPYGVTTTPDFWNPLATNNTIKVMQTTEAQDRVRSGLFSIGVSNVTAPVNNIYESLVSSTTYSGTRDYIVSAWVRNENIGYGECRFLQNTGADFPTPVFASSTTLSNPSWTHITATAQNRTQGDLFKLRLTHTGGTNWKKTQSAIVGSGINYAVAGTSTLQLGSYKGFLYARWRSGPMVQNYNSSWADIPTNGLTVGAAEIPCYLDALSRGLNSEYNGRVYALREEAGGAASTELWGFDGQNWQFVQKNAFYQGPSGIDSSDVRCYAVYKGCLYLGGVWTAVENPPASGIWYAEGPCIWRWDGANWLTPYKNMATYNRVRKLCVFNDRIYADCCYLTSYLLYSNDGIVWNYDLNFNAVATISGNAPFATTMCVYNNKLYVGVQYAWASGINSRLFYYDGVAWQPGPVLNEVGDYVTDMCVFNNCLYWATGGIDSLTSIIGGRIYKYDGSILSTDYVLTGTSPSINSFTIFDGFLRANYNITGETGILTYNNYSFFDDVSVSPVQVTFSTAATTDTDYEYLTSYGVPANDINKYRKYRLHYVQSTKKLYRQRYNGPNKNDWVNDGPDPLCDDVNRLTITNNNQESFVVELILEKSEGGKLKQHRVVNEFTPRMP